MDEDDLARLYLDMWKETIGVQKHFNDIEWMIRGLGMTALTFTLGAASLALREDSVIELYDSQVQLASIVLLIGALLWLCFYFVDAIWYHRLLIGAVRHGESLETQLRRWAPEAGLTFEISLSSEYEIRVHWFSKSKSLIKLKSSAKLRIFYLSILAGMLLLALGVQLGISLPGAPS